jgi:hypothetical protein
MRIAVLLLLLLSACASTSGADPSTLPAAVPQTPTTARGCAMPSRDTTFIQVSARFAGRPDALFDRAAAVYAQEGFEVAVADRSGGRLVSAPRYTWPATIAAEAWHGEEHPGVQALTQLAAAGPDSTDVRFEARVLCQVRAPGAADPSEDVGQQLKMLTAIMLASAFSKAGKS